MGPLQRIEFYKALQSHAALPSTSQADATNVKALFGVGRAHRLARRSLESQAAHAIANHALAAGMTEAELATAEDADIGGILPAGWFQALLAALPQILTFIAQILSWFGIVPKPAPAPTPKTLAVAAVAFLLMFCSKGHAAEPPPAKVAQPPVAKVSRCCDCCTCRDGQCNCAFPGECLYAAAYRVSLLDAQPLVVFVGQPERLLAGCRTVSVPSFPHAVGPCVAIGIPDGMGTMSRFDLPGLADVAAIRNRVAVIANPKCELGFCPNCR
jgi:hypothetical protein